MSSGSIRIIQLPEKSSVNTDDYMAVDSSANGTKKVKFTDLLDDNLSAQNKAADAQATGEAINDVSTRTSEAINNVSARVDNMINTQQNASVTTLWTGTLQSKNQSVTLSKSIANFDFIDVYCGGVESTFVRKPVANSITFHLQQQNMSDDASIQGLRWWESGLTISGTTATITKCVRCYWDDFSQVPVVSQATDGIEVIRIDGVKIGHVENDEIVDARVGANGTTYPTLGDAIRGQVTDLEDDIAYNDDGYFKIDYDIIENEYPDSSGFPSYSNWWRSDYIEVDFRNGFYYKTGRQTVDNYFYDQNHTAIKKFTLTVNNSYTKYTDVPLNAKYMVISNEKNNPIKVLNYLLKLCEIDLLNSDLDAFVNGINITLNQNKSDDGKSYGDHRIKGNFYKGGTVTVSNTKEDDYNITCYFKDASGNLTQTGVGVPYGTSKEILIESDAVYLDLYCNRYPMKGSVQIDSVDKYQNEKLEEHFNTANIVYANSKVLSHIKDAKKLLYGDEVVPLCLLHFSDIHGSSGELSRVMQMANYLGNEIDDIICTGDIVNDKYSDSISFWNSVDGTEDILICIGNHDVAIPPVYNAYGEGVTMGDAYNKYISPYISNWGAVYTSGYTYYYKDYSAKHIRLIALDYLLTGTDATNQNTWLQARLAEAKSSGYTVIIIEHTPLPNSVAISCGFNMIRNPWTYGQFDSMYQSSVDSFISAGGKFACYLAGHSHGDLMGYNSDYPNQIYIAVTCALSSGRDNDQRRVVGEKSRDAFNIVVVDTETETIKLIRVGADIDNYLRGRNICTIDYTNKSIISDY